jgi:hypothetical protein
MREIKFRVEVVLVHRHVRLGWRTRPQAAIAFACLVHRRSSREQGNEGGASYG